MTPSGKLTEIDWSDGLLPGDGDYVFFEGDPLEQTVEGAPRTFRDCDDFGLASGAFKAVAVTGGYDKTVTLELGFVTESFVLSSGYISQPVSGTDIVTKNFLWDGGVLNSSYEHSATLLVAGGTATIDPTDEDLITRDSIVFAAVNTVAGVVGATATWNPGTVNFLGGGGVSVGEFCNLTIAPVPLADVKWVAEDKTGGKYKLDVRGTCTVTNTSKTGYAAAGIGMPLLVNGGVVEVNSRAGFYVSGKYIEYVLGVPLPLGSVVMYDGTIRLRTPSTLSAENGVGMAGGNLIVVVPPNAPSGEAFRRGTINGNLAVNGGTVSVAGPSTDDLEASLSVTQNVNWTGGEFRPQVDTKQNELRTEWRTDAKFTIGGQATVKPEWTTLPAPPAVGTVWSVLYAANGFSGLPQVSGITFDDKVIIEPDPLSKQFIRLRMT